MELLLHTLTEVVRDHLEGNARQNPEKELEEEEELERFSQRRGL